jgi:hypothetical protein
MTLCASSGANSNPALISDAHIRDRGAREPIFIPLAAAAVLRVSREPQREEISHWSIVFHERSTDQLCKPSPPSTGMLTPVTYSDH